MPMHSFFGVFGPKSKHPEGGREGFVGGPGGRKLPEKLDPFRMEILGWMSTRATRGGCVSQQTFS